MSSDGADAAVSSSGLSAACLALGEGWHVRPGLRIQAVEGEPSQGQ